MFCKYCGKEINDASEFCPYCGKKLGNPRDKEIINGSNRSIETKKESTKEESDINISKEKLEAKKDNVGSKKSKKRLLFILIPIMAILLIGGAIFGISSHAYKLADLGEFETAAKYSSLLFWDSSFDTYVQNGIKMVNKEYSSAATGFKKLGDYRESESFYKESLYIDSINNLDNNKFYDAYDGFKELGDYKSSKSYLSKVKDEAYGNAKKSFSSGSYTIARGLFELSAERDYDKYIKVIDVRSGKQSVDTLKSILDFAPAKETLLLDQTRAEAFLKGKWTSSDGSLYFTMEKGGSTSYNVPWFAYGDYYFIENGVFYVYKGNDTSTKRALYNITVKDWNTIAINSNQDGNTYTLYRD